MKMEDAPMTCSHQNIRRELEEQYRSSAERSRPATGPVVTLGSRYWSPAIAVGFLGLFIVSAIVGIIALLGAIL
jgi:hypothetical protein